MSMKVFLIWLFLLSGVGCSLAAGKDKEERVSAKREAGADTGKLKRGDASPDFMAVDTNNRLVSLESTCTSISGQRGVRLAWRRFPTCNGWKNCSRGKRLFS